MQNSGRTKVFISSCPRDIKYLDRLKIHLAFLERDELGEIWDDEKILPGSLRNEKINEELLCAKVAVLLISADFLASNL